MTTHRDHLRRTLRLVVDSLTEHYQLDAEKTEGYYRRVLRRAMRDFYSRQIDAGEFIDKMIYYVDEQFRRAWNEGGRDMGVQPEQMNDEARLQYMFRADAEKEHILKLAEDVQRAAENGDPLDPLMNRAEMWKNRYAEVRDQARSYFGKEKLLTWVLGPTEHCSTCAGLEGVTATAQAWQVARASGIYPKSPNLECHGYNCQCELVPSDGPATHIVVPT